MFVCARVCVHLNILDRLTWRYFLILFLWLSLHNLNMETSLFWSVSVSVAFSWTHTHSPPFPLLLYVSFMNQFLPSPCLAQDLTCLSLCDPLSLLDGDAVLDGSTAAGSWFSVTDLRPYTNYSFWIRGCNTQGCVESLPMNVTTPPAGTNTSRTKKLIHELFSITAELYLLICTTDKLHYCYAFMA